MVEQGKNDLILIETFFSQRVTYLEKDYFLSKIISFILVVYP